MFQCLLSLYCFDGVNAYQCVVLLKLDYSNRSFFFSVQSLLPSLCFVGAWS